MLSQIVRIMATVDKQQKEIEHQVYKQELKRREAADDEAGGLFACYTDPSRNIAVGDSKAELSGALKNKNRHEGKTSEGNFDNSLKPVFLYL